VTGVQTCALPISVAPAGRRPRRDRARAERIRTESRAPGEQVRQPALPPTLRQQAREAEREQGGAEGEEGFHARERMSRPHARVLAMAQKRYLFTPGPTPVPPQVLAALAEPVLHHRAPDFREVYARVLARLKEVHRTESEVLLFTCSGTGAFESAIVNLCSPGERVLAVSAGSFGERWASMARTFGCEVEQLRYPWGETPAPEDLRRKLEEIEPVSLVFLVHSETSTGVVADVRELAAVAKEAGALVVVDAVSSLGAVPLDQDDWNLDVVVSGSQKALMAPPGLATASVSPAAWEQVARSTMPSFYFGWEKTRKAQEKLDSAFRVFSQPK